MDQTLSTMQIRVNGESRAVLRGQTLLDLITGLGLPPQTALVEHNGRALLRTEWPACTLVENDQLEILRIVAGG